MAPATCVAVLERMLGSGDAVVSVVSADWPTFCGRLSRVPGLLADLAGTAAAVVAAHPLRAALAATDAARRPRLAADLVAAEVAGILGLTPSDIPHDKGVFDIGFDSLMAVEFRARLKDGFGVSLPATVAFDHPNVTDLADFVLGLLAF
jgi:acyl carrier protein